MTALTMSTLPGFRLWLSEKRPLGVALNAAGTEFAIGDAATAWTLRLADLKVLRAALSAIRGSRRRAWAMSSMLANALARAIDQPATDFGWVNDLSIPWAGVHPGEPLPDSANGSRLIARQAAALIVALSCELPLDAREAVNDGVALQKAFRTIQGRGIRIDRTRLIGVLAANRAATVAATVLDGIDLTRIYSEPQQVAVAAWLTARGVTLGEKDGEPSFSRDHFDKAVVEDTDSARDAWARFRSAASRMSERLSLEQIEKHIRLDGRVYPKINIRNAKTGRGTVVEPCLTSLAKRNRNLILADPGYVFVALDFDRAEPTVAAALSEDAVLAQDLATGDVYRELALSVFGPLDGATTESRSACKISFLALLYGRGAAGLGQQLNLTVEEARAVMDRIWGRYPQLRAYCRGLSSTVEAGTRIRTNSGRLLPVPNRGPYQAPNFMVQGTAADIFYRGVAAVVESLGVDVLVLPVHDEILIQVRSEDLIRSMAKLEIAMTVPFGGVSVTGKAKSLGIAWGT